MSSVLLFPSNKESPPWSQLYYIHFLSLLSVPTLLTLRRIVFCKESPNDIAAYLGRGRTIMSDEYTKHENSDDAQLAAMGHQPELNRNFSTL
jgi:hypothetical protein